MKKIIMAVAVATMAAAVNAAAVTWSLSSITDSPDNTAIAGWQGYFMDATTYAAFTALTGDQVGAFASANYTYSATTVKASRGGAINLNATSGSFAPGDTLSGYVVIFDAATVADAKNFAVTSVNSATIDALGSPGSIAFGSFATATTGWQTMAVPEPTSGLLLLLGMAGLALKRKHA